MNLTVYCGANVGNRPAFREGAAALGTWLAVHQIRLVYGGGKVGLMGILADAVLAGGGQVTGVIPAFLKTEEQTHTGLTELITVETMAERKTKMLALGDAYLALPGGPGTLEEISEAYSGYRLHRHSKPCLIWNIDGAYDDLAAYFDAMVAHDFLNQEDRAALHFISSLNEMGSYIPIS